jgi:hypothetical protein
MKCGAARRGGLLSFCRILPVFPGTHPTYKAYLHRTIVRCERLRGTCAPSWLTTVPGHFLQDRLKESSQEWLLHPV